jgi:Uma2 family endonuclease
MSSAPVKTRRWTRLEYDRLIELGIIHEDEPLELLGGKLVLRDRQTMSTPSRPATRRWSRLEYDRLIEEGAFQSDERLELLGGEMIVREPQGGPHAFAVELVGNALLAALGSAWRVRIQLPIALDDDSEPEPDVSVVSGPLLGASRELPSRPVLVVEVADSSLSIDREHKRSLYARARVPEYWIINLVDRRLEVYRDPGPDATAVYGWAYRAIQALGAQDAVSPLAAPSARIAVADLLP